MVAIYSFLRLIYYEAIQLVDSLRQAWLRVCGVKNTCGGNIKMLMIFQKGIILIQNFEYIWDYTNWIEAPLFVLAFIFSFNVIKLNYLNMLCLSSWQWQIGIFALWLSWIELLSTSAQFKLIGIYVLMFIKILNSLLKFIPLALLLIAAFALSFHFLLYQPRLKVCDALFSSSVVYLTCNVFKHPCRELHSSNQLIPS